MLHFAWDNFDLCEETVSGSSTMHSTHGIVIQEIIQAATQNITMPADTPSDPDARFSLNIKDTDVSAETELQACYAREKVEPTFQVIEISTAETEIVSIKFAFVLSHEWKVHTYGFSQNCVVQFLRRFVYS